MGNTLKLLLILVWCSAQAVIIPTDRVTTWTGNVGIEGGIPTGQTIFTNMTGIDNTGQTNVSAEIQAAIATCPDGQVVYLPAGRYLCSTTLAFTYAHPIVLRGAGMTNTTIIGRITVTGPTSWTSEHTILTGTEAGSTNITVDISNDPPPSIKPGWLLIVKGNGDTTNYVNTAGYEGTWTAQAVGQAVELLSVDAYKTNFTFTPPLYANLGTNAEIELKFVNASNPNYVTNVGLENFTLVHQQSLGGYAITFERVSRCWMDSIEITNSSVCAVLWTSAYRSEMRRCYSHHSTMSGSGGGYAFLYQWKSTRNLIEDNIISQHAGAIFLDDGSVGNVAAYNFVADYKYFQTNWLAQCIGSHSSHPMFNLFEGNLSPEYYSDFIHGSSSHFTLFRNYFPGWVSTNVNKQRFAVAFDSWNRYGNVVGNVLGVYGKPDIYAMVSTNFSFDSNAIYALEYHPTEGSRDTMVRELIYQHGNYDYFNNATVWVSTNADHTLPDSLYLTGKPSFFGSMTWPPIDGSTGTTNTIPAAIRFAGNTVPPATSQSRIHGTINTGVISIK